MINKAHATGVAQSPDKTSLVSGTGLVLFGVLVLLWIAMALLISGSLTETRTEAFVARERSKIQHEVSDISDNFNHVLDRLQGLPAVIASGHDVTAALATFGPDIRPSALSRDRLEAAWAPRHDLLALNERLALVVEEMQIDIAWVINAGGDCVAASNFAELTSFIGTNYADRQYFRSAMEGQRGRQYAMGRVTNVPGLFFSAPVMAGERFLGVVTIKVDLPRLAPRINHPHAFITDENGVIILAGNRSLEMQALPGAAVNRLSTEQRLARYKRAEFATLGMETGNGAESRGLVRVAGSEYPHFTVRSERAQDGITVHLLVPAEEIKIIRQDTFAVFLLLSLAGIALIALVAGARIYVLHMRQHRRSMEATNASLNQLNAHLHRIATTDALTGCANRHHFQERLEIELARAGRHGRECSLLLIDIDFFKRVNDQYGHAGGDEALRQFAHIANGQLRSQDELGRLGGEEFAVLLPESGLADAVAVAERIRCEIESATMRFGNAIIRLTASFGVACWLAPSESSGALLLRADAALYSAKSGGRNCVVSAAAVNTKTLAPVRAVV